MCTLLPTILSSIVFENFVDTFVRNFVHYSFWEFWEILFPFHSFVVRKPEGRADSWPKADISASNVKQNCTHLKNIKENQAFFLLFNPVHYCWLFEQFKLSTSHLSDLDLVTNLIVLAPYFISNFQ